MIRQIDEVIGTADARHALALCTDGGVLYFNRPDSESAGGCLVEIPSLQRDPEAGVAGGRGWALRRAGNSGEVLLLRATQANPTKINVTPLRDESGDVRSTTLEEAWTEWGYFDDPNLPPVAKENDSNFTPHGFSTISVTPRLSSGASSSSSSSSSSASISASSSLSKLAHGDVSSTSVKVGRPPLGPSANKHSVKRPRKIGAASSSGAHRVTPSALAGSSGSSYSTGGTPSNLSSNVSPFPATSGGGSSFGHQSSSSTGYVSLKRSKSDSDVGTSSRWNREEEEEEGDVPTKRRTLTLGAAPRARRVIEVPYKDPVVNYGDQQHGVPFRKRASIVSVVATRFKSLCSHWISTMNKAQMTQDVISTKADSQFLGVCALRHVGVLCREQGRLRALFVAEIARAIATHLDTVIRNFQQVEDASLGGGGGGSSGGGSMLMSDTSIIEHIISRYQCQAEDMVSRQQLELDGVVAMDCISNMSLPVGSSARERPLVIFNKDLWSSSRIFFETCELLVKSVIHSRSSSSVSSALDD